MQQKRFSGQARNFSPGSFLSGLTMVAGVALAARALWSSFSEQSSLRGKVALITGGTRGLGLALAEECARNGCRLAICGRDRQSLRSAERRLRARGAQVLAVRCDVSSRDDVQHLVRDVVKRYGQIDILINNAGVISVGPLEAQQFSDFEDAMNVMFWGTVNTTLFAMPHMSGRGEGHIVNITSIGGKVAVPHLAAYNSAKFAATGFSEGITAELAAKGIRVTTVVPGLMRTGSHANAFFKGKNQAEYAWFSLSASSPLVAMSARRAAKKIVQAIRENQTELILGVPAKLASLAHGVAPAATTRILQGANRAMPETQPGGEQRFRGHQSESRATRSPFSFFGRRAERQWNQRKIA